MTAVSASAGSPIRRLSSEVLPAPRKPVSTVSGMGSAGPSVRACAAGHRVWAACGSGACVELGRLRRRGLLAAWASAAGATVGLRCAPSAVPSVFFGSLPLAWHLPASVRRRLGRRRSWRRPCGGRLGGLLAASASAGSGGIGVAGLARRPGVDDDRRLALPPASSIGSAALVCALAFGRRLARNTP